MIIMENLKVGDVVNISIAKGLQIVIIHIKGNNFQGVYFNSLTQELNITPMLPLKIAIKIEQVNDWLKGEINDGKYKSFDGYLLW